ncbi:O-acetyltransferase-like protein [Hapsidospora chrysogenum ATCC 11550]|uniref:O-acetyltransferase-like protein n=1 Tax=Hapsidospora chrysogenum (strain ATCC 11550 / CBS 779.69 / DSM 880 / IAM 14645 / JCM 23072 / IMI 49137) TaxID=857340 RepID=A0A086TH71_HAPC1|nr:O-acetyltransferase-like protein [Hapsidospora chrysogenum ATCC 11550]
MHLFLSAYSQSTYILQRTSWDRGSDKEMPPDGSSKYRHLAAVLFRLNALSILLPFAMATTSYASYYFAPCVSFWFLVTWGTLHIKPRWNSRLWTLAGKVLVALLLSHLLISAPGVLERVSQATHWAFGLSRSAREMRFRPSLDRFVPLAGISVAGRNFQARTKLERTSSKAHAAAVNLEKSLGPPRVGRVAQRHENNGLRLPRWLLLGALCIVGLYLCVFVLPPPGGRGESFDKCTYNAFHPYISPLVVIALLALRNSTVGLRSSYLHLPADLGRISLETYVLQYHMWLANDATGILSLGLVDRYHGGVQEPVARSLEARLLTVVFLAMAQLARDATQILGQWMFGNREASRRKGVAGRGEVVR